MRRILPLAFATLLIFAASASQAAAQDRAYLWPDDPVPQVAPFGLLLLGSADSGQRRAAIRAFLMPLGVHDLPDGTSQVPLYAPVLPDARAAATGIATEWSDDDYLERHWDTGRDAALRDGFGLQSAGPVLLYAAPQGLLVQDLSNAAPFWVRHWILTYRRGVAMAPAPQALAAHLRETLPQAPVRLLRRSR